MIVANYLRKPEKTAKSWGCRKKAHKEAPFRVTLFPTRPSHLGFTLRQADV